MSIDPIRYFFDMVSASGTVHDFEGTELPCLEEACIEAIEDARFLMSAAVLEGRDISSRCIEICNEARDVLLVVPFRDALTRDD
jgi:hypothetical protein